MLVKQLYQNAESKSLSSQHRNHKPCPNVQSPSSASKPADTKAATCDDSCAKKDRRSAEPANGEGRDEGEAWELVAGRVGGDDRVLVVVE